MTNESLTQDAIAGMTRLHADIHTAIVALSEDGNPAIAFATIVSAIAAYQAETQGLLKALRTAYNVSVSRQLQAAAQHETAPASSVQSIMAGSSAE